jgi:hypothetical protein
MAGRWSSDEAPHHEARPIASLTMADTGGFFNFDGEALSW